MSAIEDCCSSPICFIRRLRRTEWTHAYRLPIATLLVTSLVTVLPLVSANPADPTWLDGIYDEADGDSLVLLVDRIEPTSDPRPGIGTKPGSDINPFIGTSQALHCSPSSQCMSTSRNVSPARAPPLRECDRVLSRLALFPGRTSSAVRVRAPPSYHPLRKTQTSQTGVVAEKQGG